MLHREGGIADWTADHQSIACKLPGAGRADQEGHVHTGLGQAAAEVTAGTAGAENQDAHCTFTVVCGTNVASVPGIATPAIGAQLRMPTPRRSSHSATAVSTTTKPIISAYATHSGTSLLPSRP